MPDFSVTGVILAGGRASRMGGVDKGLIKLAGKSLVEHVITRLAPQVEDLLISANRNIQRYTSLGYTVVRDEPADYLGPLAGMLSGLRAANTEYILTVPCDCPFVPEDLAKRMMMGLACDNARLCVAYDGVQTQPAFTLVSRNLLDDIRVYLDSGQRKVGDWVMFHQPALVDFSDQPFAFVNINTPQDYAALAMRVNSSSTC